MSEPEGILYNSKRFVERKAYDQQAELIKELVDTLVSIASEQRPRHDDIKYWEGINHSKCAETLATDTRLARIALTKAKAAGYE